MGDDNISQELQEVPAQNSNKKIWILSIMFGVVVITLFVFLFMVFSLDKISNEELSQGTFFNLEEDKQVKFEIGDEQHKIMVDSVYDDSIDIIIQSETITANIKIGETKKFDLDGDGSNDIEVKLESIDDGVPNIFIKKISETICVEDWDCGDWSVCVSEIQTRICSDLNDCGAITNKPQESQGCVAR